MPAHKTAQQVTSRAQALRRQAALRAQAAMLRCARALKVEDQRNALRLADRSRLQVHAWTCQPDVTPA